MSMRRRCAAPRPSRFSRQRPGSCAHSWSVGDRHAMPASGRRCEAQRDRAFHDNHRQGLFTAIREHNRSPSLPLQRGRVSPSQTAKKETNAMAEQRHTGDPGNFAEDLAERASRAGSAWWAATVRAIFANDRERAAEAGRRGGENSRGGGGAQHNPGNFAQDRQRAFGSRPQGRPAHPKRSALIPAPQSARVGIRFRRATRPAYTGRHPPCKVSGPHWLSASEVVMRAKPDDQLASRIQRRNRVTQRICSARDILPGERNDLPRRRTRRRAGGSAGRREPRPPPNAPTIPP